ncbi:MAG: tetratricopeptide repeat protein [Candidatus Latescibacterota bacterium]|nr:MAG: tetratricopeptide repeat protein [Candidatus Latescibacterota bacterium]
MEIHSVLAQGRNLIAAGRYREAVRALQHAAYHRPEYPDVHNHLGVALSLLGEALRAESHLQRAVEINPEYAEAHLNLAILLFERGSYHAAREHLREFDRLVRRGDAGLPDAALDDLSKRHAALADCYRRYGLLEEAEAQIVQALHLRPAYCDLRLRLARLLFERGKLEDAEEQLQRVLQQRPEYDEALLLLGRIELERGREDAAREAWIRVQNGAAAVQARAFVDSLDARRPSARIEAAGDPPPAGWRTP